MDWFWHSLVNMKPIDTRVVCMGDDIQSGVDDQVAVHHWQLPNLLNLWNGACEVLLVLMRWVWYIFVAFTGLFAGYIVWMYLSRSWTDWCKFPEACYAKSGWGATWMAAHFVGGTVVTILGTVQLATANSCKPGIRRLHKWMGRVYVLCSCLTCMGGSTYVVTVGTIGGKYMDAAFLAYACVFLTCAFKTYSTVAREIPDMESHRRWAIRLYSQGVASVLYRIYVIPLTVYMFDFGNYMSAAPTLDAAKLVYLNTAAWCFFLPNLIVADLVSSRTGRASRKLLKQM